MTLMRAASITAYGPPEVIQIIEHPIPSPRAGEVLVRVRASPVTSGDMRIRSGQVPEGMGFLFRLAIGWSRPRNPVLGWGFAGEIVAMGPGVSAFQPGQLVFGVKGFRGGAHAEYLTMGADGPILPVPKNVTPVEASALLFGGLTAAEFLIDRAKVKAGEHVLINGATGAVGSVAIQIAKHLGAKVTAVASAARQDLARALGADHFHDYKSGLPQGLFDVVMDVVGTMPYAVAAAIMKPRARHLAITASLRETLVAALRPKSNGHRRLAGTSRDNRAALQRLADLIACGAIKPVPGPVFHFTRIREAHALAESFHKPGCIVLTFQDTDADAASPPREN